MWLLLKKVVVKASESGWIGRDKKVSERKKTTSVEAVVVINWQIKSHKRGDIECEEGEHI